ncbi:MAG: AMP-binding protein [Gordonia sp. (in: high G+C Gram-positive bacteria)]
MDSPSTTTAPRTGMESGALAQILADAAVAYGQRCALEWESREVTYAELFATVSQVADALRLAGVGPGSAVGVYLPRSGEAIVAIHAVIATGAVVAPLDVGDPRARTSALLRQACLSHVIAAAGTGIDELESAGPEQKTALRSESLPNNLVLTVLANPAGPWLNEDGDPREVGGYLLFTSGSTGLPKGVLLGASAVAHFARWAAARVNLHAEDRVAAQAALTFDLSTFDLFATALAGARAVLLPDWLKPFPADTVQWLAEHAITVAYAVPTLLRGVVTAQRSQRQPVALRAIVFAGEPYPAPALAELLDTFPEAEVHNWYGPTETNVCTAADMREWRVGEPVSIGEPIDGVHTVIIDDELVVAGPTLLTGYVIDGVLVDPTTEAEFADGVRRRAYRTGDRARYDGGGRLVLAGRRDDQVKRRGHRIDLTGMEAIALAGSERAGVPLVGAAAVAHGTDTRITVFIDPGTTSSTVVSPALAATERALRDHLPAAAQPDSIRAQSPFPINLRGKIDRIRLAEIAAHLFDEEKNR